MNLSAGLSDSISILGDLVKDVEKVLAQGGGIAAESIDLVEVLLADADFKSHLASLIADIKG